MDEDFETVYGHDYDFDVENDSYEIDESVDIIAPSALQHKEHTEEILVKNKGV